MTIPAHARNGIHSRHADRASKTIALCRGERCRMGPAAIGKSQ
jgi:hypothetical protein